MGAVAEKGLHEPLHLLDEFLAGEGGGVDRGLVEPQITDDRVEIGVGREGAQIAHGGHLSAHVVDRCGQHHAQEGLALRVGEPSRDPEVEQRGAAVGHHEEVAAVEITVEHAVDERALHEGDHPRADDRRGVDARGLDARHVVELEAAQAFHDEHPPGHELGMGTRDHVAALAEVGQHLGHVEHVGALEAEVELLADGLREQLDECGRVGQRRDGNASDEERREPRHGAQVAAHQSLHGGSLHLHDHRLARAQARRVHLGDRRGGERLTVEPVEDVLERAAEVGLDHLTHDLERLGRYVIAQELELRNQLFRKHALTARDDLAELDVGGPEVFGRGPQPSRDVGARGLRCREPVRLLAQRPRQEGG